MTPAEPARPPASPERRVVVSLPAPPPGRSGGGLDFKLDAFAF